MESGAPFFTPGQTVPAELIQSQEAASTPLAVGQVVNPADIVSREPVRHPLLSRTPKDLADDDTFDPMGYAKTYFDDLGNDRELLTHLAEVDRLRSLKPMNPVKVAVGAAKGLGQMIADAPRMSQNVAGTLMKATPGVAEVVTLVATGEMDSKVASAMRKEAKTEFAASVESQSQQTASGLVGAVDRFVVQPAARGIALSATLADAAAEKAGVGPGQLRSFVRAVGQAAKAEDPGLMSADQNADSFLQKVALAQTIDESSRGEGPVMQAAGFDMAALAQEGIVVDPQVVEDLGLLTDVTEYLPALKGFKAVARGKTLLSAPSKAAAMRGVQALRQAGASAARRAASVAGAAGKIQPTSAAIAGAVVDGGAGAAAAATIPRVARLAEKGLQAGAEMIEGSRAIPGAKIAGAVAGSAPVRGALRGLAAPFSPELDNAIPMLAAAGQGSDEQIGQAIGSTAAFGAMGGAAGGAAKGGADYVVKKRFEQIQREPVADIEYGTDPALDAAHRAQMAAIRTADPAAANSLNWIRATALPAGSELYVLPNDVFSRQVSAALGQPEGTQFDTPGFIETRPDGSTRVYLNENTTALGHEAGHALVAAMDPNSRRVLFSSIKSAYGPDQIQRFGQVYDALLGAQQGAEGQGMRGDETRIVNELAAEMLTSALYSEPLDAAPPGLYRQIIGGLARLAEATTLYQPQVGASGPLASALGVTPSAQASDFAMGFLRNAQNDPNWMAGPRPPVIPEPAPAAPAPAGGMSRREFLSGGVSTRRRNAQAGAPPVAPQPAPAAPVAPAAPTPPAAPQPAPARRQVSLDDIQNAVDQPVQPPGSVPPVIPPAAPPVIPPAAPPVIPPTAPPVPPVIPEPAALPRTSAERLARLRQQAAQPPAQPQNMRVTPEEQASLDTQRQVTGAVDAERAIAANPDLYDETAQRAFADINAALQRPQGQVAPVRLAYRSVTPSQGGAANARTRKAEQDAAYEREAQLALQGLPSDVRTLFDKVTIPYRWTSENGNVNVFAMSLDKVLTNLRTVTRRAEAAGARNLVPYATTAQGNLTPEAARQFAADLRTYTTNQANGYSGAGAEITVPQGYRGQIPERNTSYRPVAIDPNRADFINLLMGISPPSTARVTADARQRGSVPNVEAGRLAAANQRPVVQATTANPDRNTYGTNPAVGIAAPTPIVEPNPLRNEFARRGVDLTGRNLFQVTENLNLQDIQSVTPAPESGFRAPSKDLIQAGFMPEAPKLADDRTSGKAFKNFFSAVTSGEAKYRPNSPWKNLIPLDAQEGFLREYDKHTGNFDAHIGTSIPGYKDVQVRVGNAIASVYGQGGRVLDIGASEGSWAKTISALSDGRVQTVALDPNPAMANFFKTKSQVPGATYDTRAFREGFEDEGVVIQPFDSTQPFDVVHEAMVFQFISPERAAQLDEVKRLMAPDGVFFAEEKFKTSPEEWAANEDKKDREFKDLFYSRDQLAAKQAVVKFQQDPGETKAVGMVDNMVTPGDFEAQLATRFKHVAQYWDSGNFKGYAASDSAEALARMLAEIGDLNTDFTNVPTPRSVTGGSFMPTAAEYEARRALDKAAKNAPKAPKVTARDIEPVPAGTAQLARAAGPLPASYSKKPEVRAVRYSSRSGSPVASPQNFGRGVATASDKRGLPKVYFYEENSPTGADKDVVATAGKTKYGARLSTARLYDAMGEDPLDYLGTINREKADQKLIDAGYAGLRIVSGDGRRIIALFEPVAQTEIGRAEKNEGKATVPKNAPQFMPATQIPDGRKEALRDSLARRTFSLRYNDLFPGQKADVDARVDAALTARASNKANTANSSQINTEAFKEWFGDWDAPTAGSSRHTGRPVSVVVDSAGVPLRVFHTTNKDFTTFEKGRPTYDNYGFLGDMETVRHAVFFSDSVEQSNDYGRGASGAQTKPVYLDIKSPVYLDSNTDWEALADETGVSARWLINTRNAWELLDGDMGKEFVEGLQRAGYDGAIFEEEPLNPKSAPGKTYAVFDPAQIKSATGNRGTFDRSNPDIRFMPRPKETIRAAAIKTRDGRVVEGVTHAAAYENAGTDEVSDEDGGFVTSTGRYVDRQEASVIAQRAKQLSDSVDMTGWPEGKPFELDAASLRRPGSFMPAPPVDSEAFKAWFGNSKVVNADGSPKVVVHTTDAAEDFYTFRTRTPKDIGAHFGTPEQAEDRIRYKTEMQQKYPNKPGKGERGGLRSIPVFLRLENPFRIPDLGAWRPDNMRYELLERYPAYAAAIRQLKTTKQVQDFLKNRGFDGLVYKNTGESTDPEGQARLRAEAEAASAELKKKLGGNKKGYFSAEDQQLPEYKNWSAAMEKERFAREVLGAADSYAVFDPEQVKSALGNQGTFDRGNPDIRFMPRPESPERKTRADIDRSTLPPGQARDLDSWVSTRTPWAKKRENDGLENDLVVGTEEVFGYTPKAKAKLVKHVQSIPGMNDIRGAFEPTIYEFRDRLVDNLLLLHDAMPGDFRNRARMWYDGARVLAERFADRYGVSTAQAAAVLATLSPQKDWYQNVHLAEMVMEAVTEHQNTRLPAESITWAREKIKTIPAEAEKAIRKSWPKKKQKEKREAALKNARLFAIAVDAIEGKTLAETPEEYRPHWVRAYWQRLGKQGTPAVTPEGSILRGVTKGSTAWQSYSTVAKAIDAVRAPDRATISALVGEMHKVRNFYNNILVPDALLGDITVDTHAIAAALMLPYGSSVDAVKIGLGSGGGASSVTGSQGLYGVYADAYRIAAAQRGMLPRQMQSITWEALRGVYLPKSRAKSSPIRIAIEKGYTEVAQAGGDRMAAVMKAIETAGGFKLPEWFTNAKGYLRLDDWNSGRLDAGIVDETEVEEDADED